MPSAIKLDQYWIAHAQSSDLRVGALPFLTSSLGLTTPFATVAAAAAASSAAVATVPFVLRSCALTRACYGVTDGVGQLAFATPAWQAVVEAGADIPTTWAWRYRQLSLAAKAAPRYVLRFAAAAGGTWVLDCQGCQPSVLHNPASTYWPHCPGPVLVVARRETAAGIAESCLLAPLKAVTHSGRRLWSRFEEQAPAVVRDYRAHHQRGRREELLAELLDLYHVTWETCRDHLDHKHLFLGFTDLTPTWALTRDYLNAMGRAGGDWAKPLLRARVAAGLAQPLADGLAPAEHLPGCDGDHRLLRTVRASTPGREASLAEFGRHGYGCDCRLLLAYVRLAELTGELQRRFAVPPGP